MKLVSEAIDDLLAQMTNVATGAQEAAKARYAFKLNVRKHGEEVAWQAAIQAAGANVSQDKLEDAASSLHMGGHDYAAAIKWPGEDRTPPDDSFWNFAYHEFINVGLNDAVARQLWQLWKEHYGSKAYQNSLTEAKKPSTKGYEQVGGDYGDPWASGGTWYNAETGNIIHHDELSEKEWNGVDADDPQIDVLMTQRDYQTIAQSLKVEQDEAWENVEDTARQAHAEVFNAARSFPYYRMTVERDEVIEQDWADDIAEVKAQFENGEETWSAMTPVQKLVELANYKGWHEFDYQPEMATKAELSVILGIDL